MVWFTSEGKMDHEMDQWTYGQTITCVFLGIL